MSNSEINNDEVIKVLNKILEAELAGVFAILTIP